MKKFTKFFVLVALIFILPLTMAFIGCGNSDNNNNNDNGIIVDDNNNNNNDNNNNDNNNGNIDNGNNNNNNSFVAVKTVNLENATKEDCLTIAGSLLNAAKHTISSDHMTLDVSLEIKVPDGSLEQTAEILEGLIRESMIGEFDYEEEIPMNNDEEPLDEEPLDEEPVNEILPDEMYNIVKNYINKYITVESVSNGILLNASVSFDINEGMIVANIGYRAGEKSIQFYFVVQKVGQKLKLYTIEQSIFGQGQTKRVSECFIFDDDEDEPALTSLQMVLVKANTFLSNISLDDITDEMFENVLGKINEIFAGEDDNLTVEFGTIGTQKALKVNAKIYGLEANAEILYTEGQGINNIVIESSDFVKLVSMFATQNQQNKKS